MKLEFIGEIGLLRINTGKANAMGKAFFKALNQSLDQLEASSARAMIMTGYDRFFSAGLALPELAGYDRSTLFAFLKLFGASLKRVFGLPFPVIAAINGHAIAGGCVLAMQADIRIAADLPIKIGLNEVQLGLALPPVALEPVRLQLPPTSWSRVLLCGDLFSPTEATQLGLVDQVVPAQDLMGLCTEQAEKMAAMPPKGVGLVKRALRQPTMDRLDQVDDQQIDHWLDGWFSPKTQATVQTLIQRLS